MQKNRTIPEHLKPFIAEQDPLLYTPMDHASWRFIMRLSKAFFARHAHKKYLDGLELTGIHTERIPLISEMDKKLRKFGWRAVAVVGFIPPNAFMEFLSLGILPIACDMRTLEHLAYTPAPDIVHEAAGHAPILADPEYAKYLLHYGELARKVLFSDKDMAVYDAIRDLSDIKENPQSTAEDIEKAQAHLDATLASVEEISEATLLSRMGWWTFEYGLVGTLKNPKIYGAGLLSSVGESYHCLGAKVKKIPMSIHCIKTSYDITKPQPQLFVTPSFGHLRKILDRFSKEMAFKQGGLASLKKAQRSKTVSTVVLDSGIQMSGKLTEILCDQKKQPCYLRYEGPTQLAFNDQEITGQGAAYHHHGFSTPLGRLKKPNKSPAKLTRAELKKLGGKLEFESGIVVDGKHTKTIQKKGRNLILVFENCTVSLKGRVLFKPEWGTFDMGCGEKVKSVFGGAADRAKYLHAIGGYKQRPNKQKTNMTLENQELNLLYADVRTIRENSLKNKKAPLEIELRAIHETLEQKHPNDWLLRLEILELLRTFKIKTSWEAAIHDRLSQIQATALDKKEMIDRGLALL